jgi:hypothetical protein
MSLIHHVAVLHFRNSAQCWNSREKRISIPSVVELQAATIRQGGDSKLATPYILCTSPIKIDLARRTKETKEKKEMKEMKYMAKYMVREHGARAWRGRFLSG